MEGERINISLVSSTTSQTKNGGASLHCHLCSLCSRSLPRFAAGSLVRLVLPSLSCQPMVTISKINCRQKEQLREYKNLMEQNTTFFFICRILTAGRMFAQSPSIAAHRIHKALVSAKNYNAYWRENLLHNCCSLCKNAVLATSPNQSSLVI